MADYETKDSGERAEFDSGMHRDTEKGKPRFDLMVPDGVPYEEQFLTRFAALLGRGAEKYTERNWELANSEAELARARSSAFRHFFQWFAGETDEDHAAATLFNIMVCENIKRKLEAKETDEANQPWREWLFPTLPANLEIKLGKISDEVFGLATGLDIRGVNNHVTQPTLFDDYEGPRRPDDFVFNPVRPMTTPEDAVQEAINRRD